MTSKILTKLTISTIAALSLTTSALTINASARTTMKSIPARYHQVWYHYDGHHHYDALKFTSKTMSSRSYYSGKYYHSRVKLHSRSFNSNPMKIGTHRSWVVGYAFKPWINIKGWNQSAGDGEYYKVEAKTYHGTRIKVLSDGGGAEAWISAHYYSTKKVAKVLGNHHFPHEHYY